MSVTMSGVPNAAIGRPTAGVHVEGRAVGVYLAPMPVPLRDGVPVTADVEFTKPLPTIVFHSEADLRRLVARLEAMRMPALFRLDVPDERRSPDGG